MRAISIQKERRRAHDLDKDLEKMLDYFADVTHTTLTLENDDEIVIEDSQILLNYEPYRPSQGPRGETMKPWPREKIRGRKRRSPFRPSQSHDHAEGWGRHEQKNLGGENVGGGEEMGGDNVRREDNVGSSRESYTPHEEVPLTITIRGES
ncbi:OLC1v1012212C1 [Oldenlandia corymbosa var. corymbosa]|uniref:OLC1v1012212C1 n=1 Tax=Oldenlandia corymbosa var. corymbosa TaxID=529605 RepID=A0AAV1DVH3_OLDCO|nr:OLC1v1012212C1 [Oldenlandia corymbosa var. corymbosa]